MQKKYLTNYNSLIVQDLWQAHNQILLIFLLKEFIKLNVNTDIIIKKCETCGIKYKNCECCLEYTSVKDDFIEYKCLCCNMNYHKKFDENLTKNFANAYKFFNQDIKKFILLLWKGVYPYKYMDDWEISMRHHHHIKMIFTVP